jgi:hypothetical protein
MNVNLLAIIKTLIRTQNESVLADAKRVRGHFSDFAANEPKALKNAFLKCLEYRFYEELKNAPAERRSAVKGWMAQKLRDEEGLDLVLCAGALDLLEAALFGEADPDPSAAGDEWVTVAEHREAGGKTDDLTLNTEPVSESITGTESIPFSYHGETVQSFSEPTLVVDVVPQEDYKKRYEEKSGEAETLKEKLAKTKESLTAAIVIGIIVSAVSIVIGVQRYNEVEGSLYSQYSRYNSLESQHKSLQSQYESLQSQHESLQSSYDLLPKNWVISITSISVGNYNDGWINRPGERLNASEMRYLMPVITYDSQVNREITLYIKVINPDGSLMAGISSPSGYSYKTTGNISIGNSRTWDLPGWGNTSQSNYISGNYRIEVWYEGVCLGTTTVTLN